MQVCGFLACQNEVTDPDPWPWSMCEPCRDESED